MGIPGLRFLLAPSKITRHRSGADAWINSGKMIQVRSSNVKKIGYDLARRELTVEFKGGGNYTYLNVPREKARRMYHAPSMGKFVFYQLRFKHPTRKN